jgi:hypothetical protein
MPPKKPGVYEANIGDVAEVFASVWERYLSVVGVARGSGGGTDVGAPGVAGPTPPLPETLDALCAALEAPFTSLAALGFFKQVKGALSTRPGLRTALPALRALGVLLQGADVAV